MEIRTTVGTEQRRKRRGGTVLRWGGRLTSNRPAAACYGKMVKTNIHQKHDQALFPRC